MLPNKLVKTGESDEGEWIMSYADTVTLLLCFFVLFFSESKIGQEETKIQEEAPVEIELVKEVEKENTVSLDELKDYFQVQLEKENVKDFQIIQRPEDVIIRLSEKEFFNEGSFKLIPSGGDALLRIAKTIKNIDERFDVHIEGHTDSKPVKKTAYYFSNLGLSSLRAATAAEVLISYGVDKSRVQAIGYGDSRPLAADRVLASGTNKLTYLEDKLRLNRRVEFRFTHRKVEQK